MSGNPFLTHKNTLILNFKLTVPNTYFNPYIVLFGVQIKSFIGRN